MAQQTTLSPLFRGEWIPLTYEGVPRLDARWARQRVDRWGGDHEFVFLRSDEDGRHQPVQPDDHGRHYSAVLPDFWLRPAWFREDPLPSAETLLLEIAPDAYEAWLLAEIQARRQVQESH